MYLSDYHTHSRLSFDAHAPLSELAEAAADAGLDELCVTDHFDFLDENGVPAEGYDWAPAVAQHQQALPAAGERLTLKLGLELGMPHLNPAAAAAICARPEADFILGSVHNLSPERGGTDLFFLDFSTVQACYDALDDYFASLALLAATDFYDVLPPALYAGPRHPKPLPGRHPGHPAHGGGKGQGHGGQHLPGAHPGGVAAHPGPLPGLRRRDRHRRL